MANEYDGALSQTAKFDEIEKSIADPGRKWAALAAGALAPTHGGGASEGMSNALGAYIKTQNDQDALKAQYIPHIAAAIDNAQKNAMAMEKMRREFEMQDYFKKMFLNGGQDASAPPAETGQLGSGTYDIMPTANGAPSIPSTQSSSRAPSGGGQFPLDINGVAFAKMFMGKDLSPEYKMAMEGFERKPGSAYDMPGRGMQWTPDPKTGFAGYAPNGDILQSGNFNKLTADTAGATTGAQKAAENKQTLLPPAYVGKSGAPIGGTIGEYINPQEAQPSVLNAGFPASTKLPVPTDAGTLNPSQSDVLSILQHELATEKDPAAIAALKRSISRAQQSAPPVIAAQKATITPPQVDANGRPLLQSATEAAQQAADVKLANEPPLEQAKTRATSLESNDKTYADELHKSVDMGYTQYRQNNVIRSLMNSYATGVPGSETRTQLASALKNTFPGQPWAGNLAKKINNGEVGSAQEMAQILSGATLKNIISTLDGQGRVNKSEVTMMQQHAEQNKTDPDALLGIMDYQDKIYQDSLREQQARNAAIKSKSYNPETWRADYSQLRNENAPKNISQMPISGEIKNPMAIRNTAQKTVVRTGTQNGKKVVQYSDGSIDFAK